MSVRVLPAFVAVTIAVVLALVLFVPFVARAHRRHGHLGLGTAFLHFAALLYTAGLLAYVLIPLPPVAPGFCAAFAHVTPQWEPFQWLLGVPRPTSSADVTALLSNASVRQFGFNVLLFLPLGMLVRHLARRSAGATLALGLATSVFVELTQLTGIWFLYPCPYRLFDVDDLIANTAGAAVGCALAPVLRLIPGRNVEASGAPRAVTASRRLLGMACDVLLLWWLGSALVRAAELLARGTRWEQATELRAVALWFVPALALLTCTWLGGRSTLGQHAVLLRSVRGDGAPPAATAMLLRWSVGLGGFALAQGVVALLGVPRAGAFLAVAWCTVHAFGVTRTRDRRGISGTVARLTVVDTRDRDATSLSDEPRPVVTTTTPS